MLITVLTPTYNRAKLLLRLFESLVHQNYHDFQWLVIDDGSTDETEELFQSISTDLFPIIYIKKNNGGKHTALNYSHPFIKGELVLIVDSDDYLLPNAIEVISKEWQMFRDRENIGLMSYLKGYEDGTYLSVKSTEEFHIDDDISYRVNNPRIKGDRCEVVRSDLFVKYPFPEFENEKFVSEDMLWNTLALNNYDTVYANKVIYICEYLDDGLSKAGRRLRLLSGCGMMTVTKTYLNKRVRLSRRIKATWLFICYGLCARKRLKDILKSSDQTLLTFSQLPFGIVLYLYWKNKYL